MAMTPLTVPPPSRDDPTTFATRADITMSELPTFVLEANVLQADVNAKQITASTAASTATTQASIATTAAAAAVVTSNTPEWVSGTSYTAGVSTVYSPVDFRTYRRIITGAGVIDPSLDSTNWRIISNSGIGLGGTSLTTSTTLVTASPAAMSCDMVSPGHYITLPSALLCQKGLSLFSINNTGVYDVGVKDTTGTKLGWIAPGETSSVSLSDNTTAPGVWSLSQSKGIGITATFFNTTVTNSGNTTLIRIPVDGDRTFFLFGNTSLYGVVYNESTLSWGAVTLIRATVGTNRSSATLSATNQILVASCSSTTAFEAVTLSLADTTITVNSGTIATTTLAGNSSVFSYFKAVAGGFVLPYSRNTTSQCLRVITVSGTSPMIGAEQVITATALGTPALFVSGSILRTVCPASTSIIVQPYSVSGTTLTPGTPITPLGTTTQQFKAVENGNGNILILYVNTTTRASVISLSGTVETASSVVVGTATTSPSSNLDILAVDASKTLAVYHAGTPSCYANIITDTAGVASIGTELSTTAPGNTSNVTVLNVLSGQANVAFYSSNSGITQLLLNCTTASPTLSSISTAMHITGMAGCVSSNFVGIPASNKLVSLKGSYLVVQNTGKGDYIITQKGVTPIQSLSTSRAPSTGISGETANTTWAVSEYSGTTVGIVISKLEAA